MSDVLGNGLNWFGRYGVRDRRKLDWKWLFFFGEIFFKIYIKLELLILKIEKIEL